MITVTTGTIMMIKFSRVLEIANNNKQSYPTGIVSVTDCARPQSANS
jgi:hypothetical protein